jgi:hypothetical protein
VAVVVLEKLARTNGASTSEYSLIPNQVAVVVLEKLARANGA